MLSVRPASVRRVVCRRRGAVAVLLALLLIPLLAFAALCIDVGWITSTKSELQNAADSSALAGARQLLDNYSAYNIPNQPNGSQLISGAKQSAGNYATQYGTFNSAGDVASLKILGGDIQIGFTDAQGNFQAGSSGYPNTVQVVVRRDTSANGRLPLFIAPVLGTNDQLLTVSSSATIYSGLISSFDPNGGGENSGAEFNAGGGGFGEDYGSSGAGWKNLLLPVAFDVNQWTEFFQTGGSPDGTVQTNANGAPQIQVYPSPKNAPGNFGLLCIGPDTSSEVIYRNWIANGPSLGDLQHLLNNNFLPVSQQAPAPWLGSPGLKSSLVGEFTGIVGQPRLLPLFAPVSTSPYQAASWTGSNATYNIVGFVGVTVSEASGNGNNLKIFVQPSSIIDPTAVFDPATVYPAGAEPSTQLKAFTHVAPKLTTAQ